MIKLALVICSISLLHLSALGSITKLCQIKESNSKFSLSGKFDNVWGGSIHYSTPLASSTDGVSSIDVTLNPADVASAAFSIDSARTVQSSATRHADFRNWKSDAGNGTCSVIAVQDFALGGTYIFKATSDTSFTGLDPSGKALPVLTVGNNYQGGGLAFKVTPGKTAYAAGDKFEITVALLARETVKHKDKLGNIKLTNISGNVEFLFAESVTGSTFYFKFRPLPDDPNAALAVQAVGGGL